MVYPLGYLLYQNDIADLIKEGGQDGTRQSWLTDRPLEQVSQGRARPCSPCRHTGAGKKITFSVFIILQISVFENIIYL